MAGEADVFVLMILAWFFPPAAVALVTGCGSDLCLNILLTILGYLPGCIHAFWLVLRRAEANEMYGRGNWTYSKMGKYHPRVQGPPSPQYPAPYGQAQGQAPPPPPPPPGQYPAGKAPIPSQAPVDQQQGGYGYAPPPAPAQESKTSGYPAPSQAHVDQKSGEYVPPSAPADQKYGGYPSPPRVPADQRAAEVVPRVPADQKPAESTAATTAPPTGT